MLPQMKRCTRVWFIVSAIIGALLIIVGAVLYTLTPTIVLRETDKILVLKNNSDDTFLRFAYPDVPTYMKFYFFNVSNKDEVNQKGAKPILKETGPYVYRKELQRKVKEWDDDKGTVLYKEIPTYYFEPGMSNGTLTDMINHVNFVSIGLISSKKLDLLATLSKTAKDLMIRNAPGDLVETHNVDEMIFQGVDIKPYLPPFNTSILKTELVCRFVDNCKYAFFLNKNATESLSFDVKTGAPPKNSSETLWEAMDHYRELEEYDGKPNLKYWHGPSCNALNGTDGTQFPPGLDKNRGIYVFTTELCRSIYMEYDKHEVTEGISGLRFVMPARSYASPKENPDNWCFVPENTPEELLSLGGALPVAPCYDDYPVMASAPHFYMAAERYREGYEGLHPDKNLHQSFLNIEPMSGTTISAAKKVQMNMRIDPDPRPKFLKFIKNITAFPMFWAEEVGIIDEKNTKLLKDQLIRPHDALKWSSVAILILGCLIPVVLLAIFIKMVVSKKKTSLADVVPKLPTEVLERSDYSTFKNSSIQSK